MRMRSSIVKSSGVVKGDLNSDRVYKYNNSFYFLSLGLRSSMGHLEITGSVYFCFEIDEGSYDTILLVKMLYLYSKKCF